MARMSSVIYAMHNRVSATDEQASAHLDAQSLNSMQTHYARSCRNRREGKKKTNRLEREREREDKSKSGNSETIKRDFHALNDHLSPSVEKTCE